MAHEVESMVYVGKTPWHGLGVAASEGKKLNFEEAIVAAGDDFLTCPGKDNVLCGVVGRNYESQIGGETVRELP